MNMACNVEERVAHIQRHEDKSTTCQEILEQVVNELAWAAGDIRIGDIYSGVLL
jgi:hypothetical protein